MLLWKSGSSVFDGYKGGGVFEFFVDFVFMI